jgi:hypothetical protein
MKTFAKPQRISGEPGNATTPCGDSTDLIRTGLLTLQGGSAVKFSGISKVTPWALRSARHCCGSPSGFSGGTAMPSIGFDGACGLGGTTA